MAQTTTIIKALKQLLKRHGYRYRDVSQALNISESRVKFLFSQEDFSLKRMDLICQMMGIEISDVVGMRLWEPKEFEIRRRKADTPKF